MRTMKKLMICAAACAAMLTAATAQTIPVSGRITDEADRPLSGVTAAVKGTKQSVLSDAKGMYALTAAKGATVVFSKEGYITQEHKVTRTVLDVKMLPEPEPEQSQVMKFIPPVLMEDMEVMEEATLTKSAAILGFSGMPVAPPPPAPGQGNFFPGGEEYQDFRENRFIPVSKDPLSTFALEVDGAAYSNVRRLINQGVKPQPDAVRIEEFLNYFSYDYPQPTVSDPLRVSYEVGACPWNADHKLVKIGVKAREIDSRKLPPANFVFLIDVSGSMWGANRLPLVKQSLKLLINNLRDEDRVAIVTYAGSAGEALPSTPGSDKQKIRDALEELTAGGSTAGGAGIQLAYRIAKQNFREGGNNRIILCTDGDFNVGVSSVGGLESLIEQERKNSGVFLTVLGYGMGNYKDNRMQTLAEKGNGNHAYIDNIQEANKVLVNEFGGTMYTVAKDVKLQVEFNPARVRSYRLVGYESRLLEHEDFNDDTKDAGEIGAGHTVTAIYEIVPVGSASAQGTIDPLKYQPDPARADTKLVNVSPDLMTIKIRWKAPDADQSEKREIPVVDRNTKLSEDFHFASAVAMFGQLLRGSDFKGDATYDKVIETARRGLGEDTYGYRREFIRLAESVRGMAE